MNITLIADARRLWPRLWSIRLALAAAVLSGLEVAVPLFSGMDPDGWLAIAGSLLAVSAAVARVIAQHGLFDDDK